jgi:hypothetical protein
MKSSIPNVFVINSAHILKGNLNVNETVGIANDSFQHWLVPLIKEMTREPVSV